MKSILVFIVLFANFVFAQTLVDDADLHKKIADALLAQNPQNLTCSNNVVLSREATISTIALSTRFKGSMKPMNFYLFSNESYLRNGINLYKDEVKQPALQFYNYYRPKFNQFVSEETIDQDPMEGDVVYKVAVTTSDDFKKIKSIEFRYSIYENVSTGTLLDPKYEMMWVIYQHAVCQ